MGLEAYNHAAEVKARAERKAGEFLSQLERSKGGRPNNSSQDVTSYSKYGGNRKSDYQPDNLINEFKEIVQENNIPIATAYRWQQVAEMPEGTEQLYQT